MSACGGEDSPIPPGEATLIVAQASYEALVGEDRYLTFGVLDAATQQDLGSAEGLQIYLRDVPTSPEQTPAILDGPLDPDYAPPRRPASACSTCSWTSPRPATARSSPCRARAGAPA